MPVALSRLTWKDVERYRDDLFRKGNKPRTINQRLTVVGTAMNYAVKHGISGTNPVALAEKAKPKKYEAQWLSADQVDTLLKATRDWRLHATIPLLCIHGLRKGELLALLWSDYDPEAGTLRVTQNLTFDDNGHGLEFDTPKTDESQAVIFLTPTTVKALDRHRIQQETEKQKWGDKFVDHDLIFVNERGGIMRGDGFFRAFQRRVKKAGLPLVNVHAMRHSTGSNLAASGVPVATTAAALRHADNDTALRFYTHSNTQMLKDALKQSDIHQVEYEDESVSASA